MSKIELSDGKIIVFKANNTLRGSTTKERILPFVESGEYKIISEDCVQKIRKQRKPINWKRTHDITSESIGSTIMFEWTDKKTKEKIIITQYYCGKDCNPRGGYGYNILIITADGKEEWGDELYSLEAAKNNAFTYMGEEWKERIK